ncbi:MAG TPA: hypothetical protein VKP30_23920 [Polyangiaceae bacterium]|nr:hypothetical protein [Polyangiaceae bacterium]
MIVTKHANSGDPIEGSGPAAASSTGSAFNASVVLLEMGRVPARGARDVFATSSYVRIQDQRLRPNFATQWSLALGSRWRDGRRERHFIAAGRWHLERARGGNCRAAGAPHARERCAAFLNSVGAAVSGAPTPNLLR